MISGKSLISVLLCCIAITLIFLAKDLDNTAYISPFHSKWPLGAQGQLQNSSSSMNATLPLPELYKLAQKSVVYVSIYDSAVGLIGSGSGFIYDKAGHILTNYHVAVPDVIGQLSTDVTFYDGSVYPTELVGADPFTDTAVLLVKNDTENELVPLPLANSSTVLPGERVAAFGAPNSLRKTVTEGIVSALGRSQDAPITALGATFKQYGMIQTDADINPGNSGGPLLNMKGQVIGMNSMRTAVPTDPTGQTFEIFPGINFAISSNTLQKIVPSLISTGSFEHPWLGINGVDITSEIAQLIDLSEPKGVLVQQVVNDSPAQKAGIIGGTVPTELPRQGTSILLGGDLITQADGKTIRNLDDLLLHVEEKKKVGDTLQLTILRNGETERVDLVIGQRAAPTIIPRG